MTIKEFTSLTFHEASEVLRKAHKGRMRPGKGISDYKAIFGFSDTVWGNGDLTKNGTENMTISLKDTWYVTKMRVILKIRYNDTISINYHIGNTADGVTLKEISFQGIEKYWEKEFPELESIGLGKGVFFEFPLVEYRNGRKGTVADMLNKYYGLMKLKVDVAIQEMDDLISSGKFIELWKECRDTMEFEQPTGKNVRSTLTGYLGNYLVSLMSDPAGLDLKEIVCYLKLLAHQIETDYPVGPINNYFGARSYNTVRSSASMSGLRSTEVSCFKNLAEKVEKRKKLDIEVESLKNLLEVNYDRIMENGSKTSGIDLKTLKGLLDVVYYKRIVYSDL